MSVVVGNLSPTEALLHHGSVMSEQLLGSWGGGELISEGQMHNY